MATTTTNLGLPLIEDGEPLVENYVKQLNGDNAGTAADPKSMAQIIDDFAGTVKLKATNESHTIQSNSWGALSDKAPFTHSATVTATATIGANTLVELINDNAVNFANYGFAIGAISGQTITIYSVGAPSAAVTLSFDIGG